MSDEEWDPDENSKKRKAPSKPAVKLGSGDFVYMVERSSLDENATSTDFWVFSTKLKGMKFAVSLVEWEFEGSEIRRKKNESQENFFEKQLELATEDRDAMEAYAGDHLLMWISISCSPIKLDSKKAKQ
jgi:hypothetical protein